MKRKVGTMVLLAALGGLGGCVSDNGGMGGGVMPGCGASGPTGTYMAAARAQGPMDAEAHNGAYKLASVPGVMGPNGEPIMRTAPYATATTAGEAAARAAFVSQVPAGLIAQTDLLKSGQIGGEIMQAGYQCGPNGCAASGLPSSLMAAQFQGAPGPIPGGPPPGGLPPGGLPPGGPGPLGPRPPGAVAAVGALTGGSGPFCVAHTSVRFVEPAGMRITWYGPTADGKAGFGPNYLEAPARYNFAQACIYRLKLSDIPNRPGLELYPTLEVVPTNARTATFLAHSAVPVSFTPDDFAQVAAGNYVVKVVYLPDPQYQDLAVTGPDTVVSSQLEPGVDPIAEAHRRGSILLVVRMGNIDLEAPNTPAMDAPSPYQPQPHPPGLGMGGPNMMLPGMAGPGPGPQVPYGAMANMGQMPPPGMMPPGMPQGMMPPPGMMPPGMMMPPPGMKAPDLRQQGPNGAPTVPTNTQPPQPPTGTPTPTSQATDSSTPKQAKYNPSKDAPLKSFSLWPFSKKDADSQ